MQNALTDSARELELEDFHKVEKVAFPPKGSGNEDEEESGMRTPPHGLAHTFKFKSYSPSVFDRLRSFFGIDAHSYMNSVCGELNMDFNYFQR